MPKRWRIATHDAERAAALGRATGVPAVVAHLLLCRGLDTPAVAREFLDARLTGLRDPELLPGMQQAADLVHRAVTDGRRIVIYGDYDADGMTAAAILLLCLRQLRANVGCYIPNRIDEGYGLNEEALRSLARDGTQVVVTVDCGIASVYEAEVARELGITLIITDHHQFADRLPTADAVAHPQLPGQSYPFDGLCGAAVALKLAWAVCQRASGARRVSEAMRNFLMQAVGLAAIGTVADVVPLVDENRILVRHGLKCLRHYPTKGLAALEKVTGLGERQILDCDDLGFVIGPRLNAAGRLGQAMLAVELLTTASDARAMELARFIDDLNNQRQALERSVYRAAVKQARENYDLRNDPALVLCDDGWHPGVIGIVAGRLAEKYHRPVLVISRDGLGVRPAMGSGRSVPGLDLHAALYACRSHLLSHGGHAAAAGLKLDAHAVDAFRQEFCAHVAGQTAGARLAAELMIDAETPLAALTHQTIGQIEQLAPFGNGNARPLLCTSNVRLADLRRMGKTGNHLSMRVEQHGIVLRGVAFGAGDWEQELDAACRQGPVSVAYRPVINTFRGRRSIELHLTDWRQQPVSVAVD